MADVAVGDLVRWNDRPAPEVVVEVTDDHFDVRSSQHDYYRFYPDEGVYVDRQTDERVAVDSFEFVGDVCDVDLW
jgi:Uma2 family endonuclease